MDLRLVADRRTTAEVEGDSESVGRRLKALRTEQGITLARLGGMVGLSASYLSQIERNKAQPSLATLSSVAGTLGVELRSFFEHPAPVWKVVRKGRGEEFADRNSEVAFDLLSSEAVRGKFQPYRVTCRPGMEIDTCAHPGEEFVFILEAQLEVCVGEEAFTLKEGDSIHYQGSQAHGWRNELPKECVLIWALSPPFVPSGGSG
ncbi:MAG: XRE family transcriptional regulator [Anaerolineae bacterium]|nr:XRE family transcriptional regulator [Anaerolineae bacterium]